MVKENDATTDSIENLNKNRATTVGVPELLKDHCDSAKVDLYYNSMLNHVLQ